MKRSIPFIALAILSTTFATVRAQEVTVTGVTKLSYYQQTNATAKVELGAQIYGFIEGEDLDPSYPSSPRTLTPPGGTARTFSFDEDAWYWESAGYATRAALNTAYPNGTYALRMNGVTLNLNLVGDAYPNLPTASSTAGQWVNGKLQITAAQAAAGFSIQSDVNSGNGFESFEIESDDGLYFRDQHLEIGHQSLRVDFAPGELTVGNYTGEFEFDNVVHSLPAQNVDPFATAFALYSSATAFDIEVVANRPELSITVAFQNGLTVPTLRWSSTDTQAWQVQYTDNFTGWTNIGNTIVSQIGQNSVTLPGSTANARFYQLKSP
jgi:hypothetical protein